MAEDLTVPRNATLTNDAPPPNSTDASEDLTLPDGRPAPLRVECNVDEETSLSIPAAHAVFTAFAVGVKSSWLIPSRCCAVKKLTAALQFGS
jgi:hypothetical protein